MVDACVARRSSVSDSAVAPDGRCWIRAVANLDVSVLTNDCLNYEGIHPDKVQLGWIASNESSLLRADG